jgi:hypothetical protein
MALPKALFWKAPRGGACFPHCHHQHNVHIIVILIVTQIFCSSCNDVDLLGSMSAEYASVPGVGHHGGRGWLRLPWLACVYFV